MKYCDYRAFNKFLIQQLLFDIKIKEEQYLDAGKILTEVHNVPQYEFLDPNDKSAWAIREAYLYFVINTNNITDGYKYLPSFENSISITWSLFWTLAILADFLGITEWNLSLNSALTFIAPRLTFKAARSSLPIATIAW